MADALLTVNNLETYYGPIMAILGVSFSVPRGKIVTLLGADGAAQTTIIKTVCRVSWIRRRARWRSRGRSGNGP
jgi:branched-chain amino acid transport system ATP-binding protein